MDKSNQSGATQGGWMTLRLLVRPLLGSIFILAAFVGCVSGVGPAGGQEGYELGFDANARATQAGDEIIVEFGVRNTGDAAFPGDDDVAGSGGLRSSSGQVRNEFTVLSLGPVEPGERMGFFSYSLKLEPGEYVTTFVTGKYGGVELQFWVQEKGGRLYVGHAVLRPLPPSQNV